MRYIEAGHSRGPLEIDGISSEAQGCDIGDVRGEALGDIGVARTGYRELPAVCGIHATNRGPEAGGQGSFQPFKVWGLPYLPHVDISHGPW